MVSVGVLLPVRIETRFKNGDLWVRVVPDEPWFVREDRRVTEEEVHALQAYVDAPTNPGTGDVPRAWRELAAHVGAPRAAYLHRLLITTAADGSLTLRAPTPAERRDAMPVLPRIAGFPTELIIWASDARGPRRAVMHLTVKTERLLADFADPDVPDDRRWWQNWDEAVAVGVAGIIPAADFGLPIETLYVTGLGDSDPAELFSSIASEGRIGLLEPGTPTNSVDGEPAAPLATDSDTWWNLLKSAPGESDADVSRALTGNRDSLGNMPGGTRPQRSQSSALVTAMWPALWGFAAAQVFDIARGLAPARWAGSSLFPEGAYPVVRFGSLPYGLLPTTAWSSWESSNGDPPFEITIVKALLKLRGQHAASAHRRGTAAGRTPEQLLDLIADTPTSTRFRFRMAWPLELWWLAMVGSGLTERWHTLERAWTTRYRLAEDLAVSPLRRYGAVGRSRRIGIPLVLPSGVEASELPGLLRALADAAVAQPSAFANTAKFEEIVLGGRGGSLLLRLAIRSLQVTLGDLGRLHAHVTTFDPEPFSRNIHQSGRLEQLIASVTPVEVEQPADAVQHLKDILAALNVLESTPVRELERMLAATADCSTHRIDPWLVAPVQRRLDQLHDSASAQLKLGAYGWVDGLAPGNPGPTNAGLVLAPSAAAALTAAVLRDRAVSDVDGRWDLDVTSKTARIANRLADQVRIGAHLPEVLGREIERIVGKGVDIERLRRDFPVRIEHAGRRVCDGLQILAEPTFPISVDAVQAESLQELRDAVDTYADLLVADAVHHLVEGRPEAANASMDGAAGLSRPPELSLLRTPREGRAVSTSVVLAFAHVADAPLPAGDAQRALVSPVTTLDPSVAAYVLLQVGAASTWEFEVVFSEGLPTEIRRIVHLTDLDLSPADALTLTRTKLEGLAIAQAADLEGLVLGPGSSARVAGGSAASKYERASILVGVIGRNPAGRRALSEDLSSQDPNEGIDSALSARYFSVCEIGGALSRALHAQVQLFGPDANIGTAQPQTLRSLLVACARWGIAPDPPQRPISPDAQPMARAALEAQRLADRTVTALAQLDDRLGKAPDVAGLAQMSPIAFADAATALVSPTGQVALTGTVQAEALPPIQKAVGPRDLDQAWLTVVAAARRPLARLEAIQLSTPQPFVPWTNRPEDPWQTNVADTRRLVAIYAEPAIDFSSVQPHTTVAFAALDRFSEVIPSADQAIGAAFGFDAPAARPQQAILLAVPPDITKPLDPETLAQILVETRELAHARMARPVDLDDSFRGLAPTALVPASGAMAIPLEREP